MKKRESSNLIAHIYVRICTTRYLFQDDVSYFIALERMGAKNSFIIDFYSSSAIYFNRSFLFDSRENTIIT